MGVDFTETAAKHSFPQTAEPAASGIGWPMRIVLLVVFLYVTLPTTPLLVETFPALQPLVAVHLAVHAVPLFLTTQIDAWLQAAGELSPAWTPVWSILTGLMLWPLLALSMFPALWASKKWRTTIVAYGIVATLATIAAAWWVFTHLGRFF